jgi:hypothetical protein
MCKYQKVEEKFLSFRRGWRYHDGQDRARALFVEKLVLPHAGRYTFLDQGTEMRVVGHVKDWLSNSRSGLPKTADNNSVAVSAIGFSNRSIRIFRISSRCVARVRSSGAGKESDQRFTMKACTWYAPAAFLTFFATSA